MKWLHLSDLHIRENAKWVVFKKEVFDSCRKQGPIDLVVVTGDFHNFNEKDDFSKATEFLRELMQELNLNIKDDLFLIPGNHDGSFPICECKDAFVNWVRSNPCNLPEREWTELSSQFKAYESFVKNVIPDYEFEFPAKEHIRVWKNCLGFIHCNTAVASDGKCKDKQLVDIDGIAKLVERLEDIPYIILAHNHYKDLHQEIQEQLAGICRVSGIKAYFCGDTHRSVIDMIKTGPNQYGQIPCVVSYKSAADSTDTYSSCGIIIGTWERQEAVLAGWIWTAKDGMQVDSQICNRTIDMGIAFEKLWMKRNSMQSDIERGIGEKRKQCNEVEQKENEDADVIQMQLLSKSGFRKWFYSLSDNQRLQFNQMFAHKIRELNIAESHDSVDFFYEEVKRGEDFQEMLEIMECILKWRK